MFNVDTISTKLYGVVGFRQPFNPAYQKLDAANQISRSGYFITDNPFAKIEYLYDNVDFKALTDPEFNTYLERIQKESITNVSGRVFNKADYIDRNLLYRFAQNKTDIDTLPDGFVGERIRVSDEKNVAFKITRVLLSFNQTGPLELMLFNTAKEDPIFSESITVSSKHQEVVLNWDVDNSGDTYKGEYYLGYVSDGSLEPFKRNYENANIKSVFTYLWIDSISVPGHTGTQLFDLTTQEGLSESTGINPDITVYEDFTDLIVQNEHIFAQAISLDLQINVLSQYHSSLRSNRNERNSERIALRVHQQIEGQKGDDIVTITGLRPQLNRAISTIKVEIDKLKKGYFGEGIFTETLN